MMSADPLADIHDAIQTLVMHVRLHGCWDEMRLEDCREAAVCWKSIDEQLTLFSQLVAAADNRKLRSELDQAMGALLAQDSGKLDQLRQELFKRVRRSAVVSRRR